MRPHGLSFRHDGDRRAPDLPPVPNGGFELRLSAPEATTIVWALKRMPEEAQHLSGITTARDLSHKIEAQISAQVTIP